MPGMIAPSVAARAIGISDQTVVAWIRRGDLAAYNVARPGAKRPRYMINQADVDAFLAARRVAAR